MRKGAVSNARARAEPCPSAAQPRPAPRPAGRSAGRQRCRRGAREGRAVRPGLPPPATGPGRAPRSPSPASSRAKPPPQCPAPGCARPAPQCPAPGGHPRLASASAPAEALPRWHSAAPRLRWPQRAPRAGGRELGVSPREQGDGLQPRPPGAVPEALGNGEAEGGSAARSRSPHPTVWPCSAK